jgi:hypothetical protein
MSLPLLLLVRLLLLLQQLAQCRYEAQMHHGALQACCLVRAAAGFL